MKNTGLKNEILVSELTLSGSTAIKTKNEFGVHIFSGSIVNDGVISSTLEKPKYNTEELLKSIDTTIIELIPVRAPELPDTVLRSIYNIALGEIADLTQEVATLNGVILTLQANITELEIVTQSLRVQIDGNDITLATLQNQNEQLGLRVQSSIIDLQNSIQKAASEAIQRVSLTARNDSLIQEAAGLRTELESAKDRLEILARELTREAAVGSELAKGAFGGNGITANPAPIEDSSISPIAYRARPKNDYEHEDNKFINGQTLSILNATDEDATITFTQELDIFDTISPITVRPKQFGTVTLRRNKDKIDKLKQGSDSLYLGKLVISSTSGTTFSINMELQIQRGARYRRPSSPTG
jgi:hypothetical protein